MALSPEPAVVKAEFQFPAPERARLKELPWLDLLRNVLAPQTATKNCCASERSLGRGRSRRRSRLHGKRGTTHILTSARCCVGETIVPRYRGCIRGHRP